MGNESSNAHRLGRPALAALVVASMIGAGVFTTSGFALADLGTPGRVLLVWVLGGLLALIGALSYGLIARRVIESGGEYVYLARNVHPLAGFLAGWVSMLAGFSGAIAFAASAFEAYLSPWFPENSVAIGLVLIAALLHGFVPRLGVATQTVVVAVKIGTLIVFMGIGTWLGASMSSGPLPEAAPASPAPVSVFATSLVWIFLSYSGFNAAVYVAEEADDPENSVLQAMLWATLVVTLIYIGLNALFVYAAPADVVAGVPNVAFVVARYLGPAWFAEAVRWVVLMALATSVLSMVMTGPRVYAKMADDGLLPAIFGSERGHARAIILQAGLAITLILVSGLRELLSYLGFTLSLSSAMAIASIFVTYRREPDPGRPLWHWIVPLVYVVAVLALALLAARRNSAEFVAAVVTLASGCLLYLFISGRRKIQKAP